MIFKEVKNLVDYSCKYYYSWYEVINGKKELFENVTKTRVDGCKNEKDLVNKITDSIHFKLNGLNYSELTINVTDIKRIVEKLNNCYIHVCYIKKNEEKFGKGHFIQAILADQVVCFGTFTEEDIEKFKDKTFILNNVLNPNKLHKEKPFFRGENERVDFKKLEEDLRTRNLDFYTIKDAQRLLQDKLKKADYLWRDKFVTSQEYFGLDI